MSEPESGRDPLELLAEDFAARFRRGERPSLSEYAEQHPEFAEEIRALFPALLVLEEVRPGAPSAENRAASAIPFRQIGEYRILREIGRGGMGVVYEAEQESLGRRVALKVLPPGALASSRQVERFRREAKAAARLHHTNLVPLFGVGEDEGTYYYVMQYIDGRPLDDVLRELRRLRDQGASPQLTPVDDAVLRSKTAGGAEPSSSSSKNHSSADVARTLWTGQFHTPSRQSAGESGSLATSSLAEAAAGTLDPEPTGPRRTWTDMHRPYARSVAHIGVQVADALEYAAGQGILHRDVKPSNLLLDVFGTVWLTDFGLAKTSGTPDLTHTGDLLGTLRYMAPERFQGQADVRSDVYALGLTLYELLALTPAFDASGQAQLVRSITMATPKRLDEINPHLPRDLITIVHKAMASAAADRYQTPGALAEDLRCFLDGRPIRARRLSLNEQAWRWCRRNPAAAALVAMVGLLCALAVGGGLWVQQQKEGRRLEAARREGRVRQAVEAALDDAVGMRNQGLWPEARSLLTQAEGLLGDAGAGELRRRLASERADLELVATLEGNRMNRSGLFGSKAVYTSVVQGYSKAFGEAGLALDRAGQEGIAAGRIRALTICAPLVAALDDWAVLTPDVALRRRLEDVARLADPDPSWRDRLRDPGAWGDRLALEKLEQEALEPAQANLPPNLLTTLGVLLVEAGGDAEPLLREAQRRRPNDFWLNFELAMLLRTRDPAAATGFCRAALVGRPRSAAVCNLLGMTTAAEGRLQEAAAAYRNAIALDPALAAAHTNLGLVLMTQGRLGEALAAHRRAVALDPKGGLGYSNLADALVLDGRTDDALAAYRQALVLDPNLDVAYNNLGLVLSAEGHPAEAKVSFHQAIALNAKGSAPYHNLGNLLKVEGRFEESVAAYRQAIALDPKGPLAHVALGDALHRMGRFAEARAEAKCWLARHGDGDLPRLRAEEHLQHCERLLAMSARLPALLEANAQPSDIVEQRELARYCLFSEKRHAAAARLFRAAFAAKPDLAGDLETQDRYNAACAATLAGAGRGIGAAGLSATERSALRQQAREWLHADLAAWDQTVTSHPSERARALNTLRHWQRDADLAPIRDAAKLSELPPSECDACQALWRNVDQLREKLRGRAAETTPARPSGPAHDARPYPKDGRSLHEVAR